MKHLWVLAGLTAIVFEVLPAISAGHAQSAADHAASAHGRPIINGHDVQPTPYVVRERWRHHELMLKAQKAEAAGRLTPITPRGGTHP